MEPEQLKPMQRVLFLCSGNYYRSRFAEILFNWHAEQLRLSWSAESRGLALQKFNPGPISCYTMSSLAERGITSARCERYPLLATDADLSMASRIIAVKESEHRPMVEARFPAWRDRVEYWHIHDVDCESPDVAVPHLEREVLALVKGLAAVAA